MKQTKPTFETKGKVYFINEETKPKIEKANFVAYTKDKDYALVYDSREVDQLLANYLLQLETGIDSINMMHEHKKHEGIAFTMEDIIYSNALSEIKNDKYHSLLRRFSSLDFPLTDVTDKGEIKTFYIQHDWSEIITNIPVYFNHTNSLFAGSDYSFLFDSFPAGTTGKGMKLIRETNYLLDEEEVQLFKDYCNNGKLLTLEWTDPGILFKGDSENE